MSKKKELQTVTTLVKLLLTNYTQARNSDSFLYLKVIESQAYDKGINLHKLNVIDFLSHSAELGFAPFETVRRTRQKLQRENPDLAASEAVQELRNDNEQAYREFARG